MSNDRNYNIEDTGALMISAKGKGRTVRVVLIVIAVILVAAIALIGAKKFGDKRYNDQIKIADRAFVEGDYVTAEAEYLKAVTMNKRETKARESLAYTYAVQSKTEQSVKIYEELYEDTKEEKYQKAAQEASEGRMPIDTTLSPAPGNWRMIGMDKVPYREDCERFVLSLIYDCLFNYEGEALEYDSNIPSGVLVPSDIMNTNYLLSIEERNALSQEEISALELVKTVSYENDPKGWLKEIWENEDMFHYLVSDVELIDSAAKNVFNVSDEYIRKSLQDSEAYRVAYKDGDKYYQINWNRGSMDFEEEYINAWTDGSRYCIQFDVTFLNGEVNRKHTFYALIEPKLINDKHYWSVYSISTEMPAEIASTQARIYDLNLNEEYNQFDLDADGSLDRLLISADVNSEGYVRKMDVQINGDDSFNIKDTDELDGDAAYRYMPSIKMIRLKGGKCLLYIHTSTRDGYYYGGWVFEKSGNGLEMLLETKNIVEGYYKEANKELRAEYRPYEVLTKAENSDIVFEVGFNDVRSNDIPKEYRYRYEKGKLREVAEEKKEEPKNKEEPKPESEPEPDWRKVLVEPRNTTDQGFHGYVNSPEGLNMRYGPGEEYDVIEILPNNAIAEEVGWEDGGEWIYIYYNGKYGWVNAQYFMMQGGRAKPVIYLYPPHTMDISVKLTITDGQLTRTIPADTNGTWYVKATPDGQITDKASGKHYEYIFWESTGKDEYDWSHGYVVAGYEVKDFLHHVLPKMGLNKKETEDFIEYWQPRLQKNKYNLVTFQTDCYTNAAKLEVYPNPDSVLRVFMACRPIEKPIAIASPTIIPFNRKGFTVVEWGGTEIR